MRHYSAVLVAMVLTGLPAAAQAPARVAGPAPGPILFVRFALPSPTRVAFYQGSLPAGEFPTPVSVGLRPGYVYRMRLGNLPDMPGVTLFPTIEVRGTLLAHELNPVDYPVPITFSRQDLERVTAGALLTKVVYLEDPLQAMPVATLIDEPIEVEIRPGQQLLDEARLRGRPLLIVRLGARSFTDQQLARESVPGTVQFPGESIISPAGCGPFLPYSQVALFDPNLGPKSPTDECLKDGGDVGRPAGFDQEGRLRGVDPSDTVAEYKDARGDKHIAPSNRVCICVPRFAAVYSLVVPTGYGGAISPAKSEGLVGGILLRNRIPSATIEERVRTEVALSGERASGVANALEPLSLDELMGPANVRGSIGNVEVEGNCVPSHILPPGKLVLEKSVDKHTARIGDLVTFSLRYTNLGGQAIGDVAVEDSLTGRLEYVPGSAKTDRAAALSMVPNDAGSLLLRWAISGKLLPGESGTITFQVRVR
jgi:uncharacterized repeat protein (TIGR01451 family)